MLKPTELAALLDFYNATEHERETALSVGLESRRRQRRRAFTDDLPDAFQRFSDLQADAIAISHYEYGVIPGPLQSPEYVERIIRLGNGVWWEAASDDADARIEFRREQQRRILAAAPAKKLSFVFTEEALHNRIGGESVMQGQVIHLLQLSEQNPELSVQIIPTGTQDNPALGGGLAVLDFDAAPRICFISVLYGPYTYHDHPEDTAPIVRVFEKVRELALSPEDSRALLIRVLKEK
jgi:hypothetical protein